MIDYQKFLIGIRDSILESPAKTIAKLEVLADALNGAPSCYHDDILAAAFSMKEEDDA